MKSILFCGLWIRRRTEGGLSFRWRRSRLKIGGIGGGVLHAETASLRKPRAGERFFLLAAIHHRDVEATCGMAGAACFFEVFDGLAGIGRGSLPRTIAFSQTAAAAPPAARAGLTKERNGMAIVFRHTLSGVIERSENIATLAVAMRANPAEYIGSFRFNEFDKSDAAIDHSEVAGPAEATGRLGRIAGSGAAFIESEPFGEASISGVVLA